MHSIWSASAEGCLPFEKDERVAFLGDSVTASGYYVPLIRLFYATRFPDRPLRMYNCGIGGARAQTTWPRLYEDCLSTDPTTVCIMLGMNDSAAAAAPDSGAYQRYMTKILDAIAATPSRRTVLMVPSPYDDTALGPVQPEVGRNHTIRRFGEWLATEGRKRSVPVVDFNTPLLQINAQHQAADPAFSVIGPDRIHLGERGHAVMACTFLQAQGIDGPVSRIEVNAGTLRASTHAARAEKLERSRGGLSFVYTPSALPFPVKAWSFAGDEEEWVPFMEHLNREWLVARGLPRGRWRLRLDGAVVGTFTSDRLGEGIDIGREPASPTYRKAHEVMALCGQIQEAEQNLRSIARVRWIILEPNGIDIDDTARADAAVRAFLAERPDQAHWQESCATFFRFRSPAMRHRERLRMEGLMDHLYQRNLPTSYRIELLSEQQRVDAGELAP